MPESLETAPPPDNAVFAPPPPAQQEPLKVKAGDKYMEAFARLEKAEKEAEAPPAEKPPEEPKPEVKTTETEVKPAAEKPVSPLDIVTADKKPEVKEEEEDVLKDFDEKTPDWKRAREVMKTQSREKKELQTKIAELAKVPKSDPEEIARIAAERDALKASLAEREELIKSVDVRLSDEYRTALQKRDTKIGKVANKARAYGADADALIGALTLPDGPHRTQQIKAAMAEVEPEDRTEIRLLLGEVDGLNEQLAEFEQDAPRKYEEIQAKRQAALQEQQEQTSKLVIANFGKVTERLPNEVVTLREVPDDVPGAEDWNSAIKSAKENALRILSPGGSDFNESAAIAVKGAHYDAVMNMFLKEHGELLDARKRLAEYDSGGPDFKAGTAPKQEKKSGPKGTQGYFQALEALKSTNTD